MNYQYPFDISWSKQEVIDVVHFFNLIEKAYEKGISRHEVIDAYRKFKQIVPSKSEEKQFFAEFEKGSGYSSYHVVKKAREQKADKIKM
ncbi:Uncharacterized protein YktA, UPF0223 family [Oceanobacillus limi]|uniref:UPF0223 protein SAMN05216389_108100 n=1 Tax=Oceanobacillus limi TaxID=930131 RepID=A0A1I0DAN3_9BACI|nr:UPF0223 family protein [Oceanobacillus limi]SET29338.1 Uncharacterized protein YktA, UPF0223 family [Oceanobacillus limi]